MKENTNRKNTGAIIGTLVLIMGITAAFLYIFIGQRTEFNADFTDTLVWAAASADSGSLLNHGFWYAYLLPFGGSLIMLPLVKIFGVTYLAHEIGMCIFTLIFAAAMLMCIRSMKIGYSLSAGITGIMLILLLASSTTRMIFYGHIIHYSLGMLFTFVAFCLFNHMDYEYEKKLDRRHFIIYLCLLLWIFLCCINGESTLMIFFVPFVGAIVLKRLIDINDPISWSRCRYSFMLLAGIACAGGLGYIVRKLFFNYNAPYEGIFTDFLPYNMWMFKEHNFITDFVVLLTGNVADLTPLISTNGLIALFEYLFAVIILIVPIFALISYKKLSEPLKLYVLYYFILFGLTLFIYAVSYAQLANWRICALLGTGMVVTILYIIHLLKSGNLMRFGIILSIVVIMVTACDLYLLKRTFPGPYNVNKFDEIISLLDERGLSYGYSSYWNGANAITILSDSRIHVRSIVINEENGDYEIYQYNAKPEWYDDRAGIDRYFLILDADERELCSDLVSAASEEIKYNDNTYIYIYENNLFKDQQAVY